MLKRVEGRLAKARPQKMSALRIRQHVVSTGIGFKSAPLCDDLQLRSHFRK